MSFFYGYNSILSLSQATKDLNVGTNPSKRCLVILKNVPSGQAGQTGIHALHHVVSMEHSLGQDGVNKAMLV